MTVPGDSADIDAMLDELDRQERTDFFGSFSQPQPNVACKPGVFRTLDNNASTIQQQALSSLPSFHQKLPSDFTRTVIDDNHADLPTPNNSAELHRPPQASIAAATPMSEEDTLLSFHDVHHQTSSASLSTTNGLQDDFLLSTSNGFEHHFGEMRDSDFSRDDSLSAENGAGAELLDTKFHTESSYNTNTQNEAENGQIAELISFSPKNLASDADADHTRSFPFFNDSTTVAAGAAPSGGGNLDLLVDFGIAYNLPTPAEISLPDESSYAVTTAADRIAVTAATHPETYHARVENDADTTFSPSSTKMDRSLPEIDAANIDDEMQSTRIADKDLDEQVLSSLSGGGGQAAATADSHSLSEEESALSAETEKEIAPTTEFVAAMPTNNVANVDSTFDNMEPTEAVVTKTEQIDIDVNQSNNNEAVVDSAVDEIFRELASEQPETTVADVAPPPPPSALSEPTVDAELSPVVAAAAAVDEQQSTDSHTHDAEQPASIAAAPAAALGRARRHIQAAGVADIDDAQVDTYLKSDFLTPKIDDNAAAVTPNPVITVEAPTTATTSSGASSSSAFTKSATGWLGTAPGAQPPEWVPDEMAPLCMSCGLKFNLVRRRHHCRCCGRVLCNQCCNSRAKLAYLPAAQSEARVCAQCCADLLAILTAADIESPKTDPISAENPTPVEGVAESAAENQTEPKNSTENADAGENSGEVAENSGLSLTKPRAISNSGANRRGGGTSSILKRRTPSMASTSAPSTSSTSSSAERRSVMFSDGIRPGGDLAEMYSSPPRSKPYARMRKSRTPSAMCAKPSHLRSCPAFVDKQTVLPVTDSSVPGGHRLDQSFGREEITKFYADEGNDGKSLEFAVSTDVRVTCHCSRLKFWHATKSVWCFATRGLRTVGQNEFVLLLERNENDESLPPHDVFKLVHYVYTRVCTGKEQPVGEYGVVVLPNAANSAVISWASSSTNLTPPPPPTTTTFLGRKDIAGIIFVRPTNLQSLEGISPLPEAPFYAALLVIKYEMPWARHFPLRLILSLGAKFQYYPCPLVNVRDRDCVLGVAGDNAHATIMSLLCDFRQFKYTLPRIPGAYCIITTTTLSSNDEESGSSSSLSFHDKNVTFSLPKSHYDMVMHVLGTSADNVLAFGTDFVADRKRAAAHLVAVQYDSDDGAPGGQFETRAVAPTTTDVAVESDDSMDNTIAALFVVFNRKLKSGRGSDLTSLDDKCRLSIVEDGVMIEITSDAFDQLKASLRKMVNVKYDILLATSEEGSSSTATNCVSIVWVDDTQPIGSENDSALALSLSSSSVTSPIDGRALGTFKSQRVQIQDSTDYINGRLAVRCTEVFFLRPATIVPTTLHTSDSGSSSSAGSSSFADINANLARLINSLAQAVCRAVQPYLPELRGSLFAVSLFSVRTNLTATATSYEIGANGVPLEMPQVLSKLDELLIPVLYGVSQQQQPSSSSTDVVVQAAPSNINCQLELFFRII